MPKRHLPRPIPKVEVRIIQSTFPKRTLITYYIPDLSPSYSITKCLPPVCHRRGSHLSPNNLNANLFNHGRFHSKSLNAKLFNHIMEIKPWSNTIVQCYRMYCLYGSTASTWNLRMPGGSRTTPHH